MARHLLLCAAALCALFAASANASFSKMFHHGVGQQPRPAHECGEALHLTPLLREGRVQDARNQSRVDPPLGGLESYSGYFTTNKDQTNHMFWWYFPALNGNVSAPVLIWLQGGPGGSSLFGLFSEMGPLQVNEQTQVTQNPYTWNKKYAMLFIDNPVGAGFSYTDNDTGYCNDTKVCVASNLYSLLQQFYQVFPEKATTGLYITGESYAGHYVPGLASYIHEQNAQGSQPKIPLAGIAIGDGWVDPATMILAYPDLMFNIGVADGKQKLVLQKYCTSTVDLIVRGDMLGAFDVWDQMINGDVFPYPNYYHNISGSNDYDNFMNTNAPASFGYYANLLNQPAIRQAIHVGSNPYPNNPTACEHHLLADFMVSFKRELGVLMDNYKVLIYSGQLDVIIGAALTEAFLPTVPWSQQAHYWDMDRLIWKVQDADDQVAGYVRTVGSDFAYVVVRGAGHIVPYDQPRASLDMITRFVEGLPWTN